ncbi:MAG TPA: N-acetylmuramoyl-L-alanine amidase [Pseudonocardiaceae bacterium]
MTAVALVALTTCAAGCGDGGTAGDGVSTAVTSAAGGTGTPAPAGTTATGAGTTTAGAAGSVGTATAGAPGTAAAPLAGRTVVLDPGHNGGNAANPSVIGRHVPAGRGRTKPCNTTGTETNAGYPEHAFTWDVAQRVRDLLVARGAAVRLTRQDDRGVGPCVDQRAAAGNGPDVDAVVSIHADGSGAGARGFHVAYSDPPLNPAQAEQAPALARALRDAMRAAGFPDADYIGAEGLDGRDDLGGLNLATRPAVLVECANLRNAAEAALASSPEGRARYAAAIAEGITRWLTR